MSAPELLAMLQRLEFAGDHDLGDVCPVCEALPGAGVHRDGCALRALLDEGEAAVERERLDDHDARRYGGLSDQLDREIDRCRTLTDALRMFAADPCVFGHWRGGDSACPESSRCGPCNAREVLARECPDPVHER